MGGSREPTIVLKPGDVKLVIRAEPGHEAPAIVRLRQAFKLLLRRYGLRILEAVEVTANDLEKEESKR